MGISGEFNLIPTLGFRLDVGTLVIVPFRVRGESVVDGLFCDRVVILVSVGGVQFFWVVELELFS